MNGAGDSERNWGVERFVRKFGAGRKPRLPWSMSSDCNGLHPLNTARGGVRDGMTFTHAGGNRTSEQWDLDPIGNQQAVE